MDDPAGDDWRRWPALIEVSGISRFGAQELAPSPVPYIASPERSGATVQIVEVSRETRTAQLGLVALGAALLLVLLGLPFAMGLAAGQPLIETLEWFVSPEFWAILGLVAVFYWLPLALVIVWIRWHARRNPFTKRCIIDSKERRVSIEWRPTRQPAIRSERSFDDVRVLQHDVELFFSDPPWSLRTGATDRQGRDPGFVYPFLHLIGLLGGPAPRQRASAVVLWVDNIWCTIACAAADPEEVAWAARQILPEELASRIEPGQPFRAGANFSFSKCWRRRTLRVKLWRCSKCGYDTGGVAGRCPECGAECRAHTASVAPS